MQTVGQSGEIAEQVVQILRFVVACLIFITAVAVCRWGIRTLPLDRGGKSNRWRNSFSAVNFVVLVSLLLLRRPAGKLFAAVGAMINRSVPASERGWPAATMVGIHYMLIATATKSPIRSRALCRTTSLGQRSGVSGPSGREHERVLERAAARQAGLEQRFDLVQVAERARRRDLADETVGVDRHVEELRADRRSVVDREGDAKRVGGNDDQRRVAVAESQRRVDLRRCARGAGWGTRPTLAIASAKEAALPSRTGIWGRRLR